MRFKFRRDFIEDDARFDAEQEVLLKMSQGEEVRSPGALATTMQWRIAKDRRRRHWQEAEAFGKFLAGGRTDLYGRKPVLHGEEYRAHLREQNRLAERRRRERKRREREEGTQGEVDQGAA